MIFAISAITFFVIGVFVIVGTPLYRTYRKNNPRQIAIVPTTQPSPQVIVQPAPPPQTVVVQAPSPPAAGTPSRRRSMSFLTTLVAFAIMVGAIGLLWWMILPASWNSFQASGYDLGDTQLGKGFESFVPPLAAWSNVILWTMVGFFFFFTARQFAGLGQRQRVGTVTTRPPRRSLGQSVGRGVGWLRAFILATWFPVTVVFGALYLFQNIYLPGFNPGKTEYVSLKKLDEVEVQMDPWDAVVVTVRPYVQDTCHTFDYFASPSWQKRTGIKGTRDEMFTYITQNFISGTYEITIRDKYKSLMEGKPLPLIVQHVEYPCSN